MLLDDCSAVCAVLSSTLLLDGHASQFNSHCEQSDPIISFDGFNSIYALKKLRPI